MILVEIGMIGSLGTTKAIEIIGDLSIRACEGPACANG